MTKDRRVGSHKSFAKEFERDDELRRKLAALFDYPYPVSKVESAAEEVQFLSADAFGDVRGIINEAWQRISLGKGHEAQGWHLGACTSKVRGEFAFGTSQPQRGVFTVQALRQSNPFLKNDTFFLLKGRMRVNPAEFSATCPIRGSLAQETQKDLHDGLSRLGQIRRNSGQRAHPWQPKS